MERFTRLSPVTPLLRCKVADCRYRFVKQSTEISIAIPQSTEVTQTLCDVAPKYKGDRKSGFL